VRQGLSSLAMTGPAPGAGIHRKKVVIAEKEEKIEVEAEIIEALRKSDVQAPPGQRARDDRLGQMASDDQQVH